MAKHTIISFDCDHTTCNDQTYIRTIHASTTRQLVHSCLTTCPISSGNIHENRLYESKLIEDVGSARASSHLNTSEHYDNTCMHTYDSPLVYLEDVSLLIQWISLLFNIRICIYI